MSLQARAVSVLLMGVVVLAALASPAFAWEAVQDADTAIVHISRSADDTPGVVKVAVTGASMNAYWATGNFDETGTACPPWGAFQEILFDEDCLSADYGAAQGNWALVICPDGRRMTLAPTTSNVIRKTWLVDASGTRVATLPVSAAVVGTVAVSSGDTKSSSGSVSGIATVAPDPATAELLTAGVVGIGVLAFVGGAAGTVKVLRG